jgi:hypothetical protein
VQAVIATSPKRSRAPSRPGARIPLNSVVRTARTGRLVSGVRERDVCGGFSYGFAARWAFKRPSEGETVRGSSLVFLCLLWGLSRPTGGARCRR